MSKWTQFWDMNSGGGQKEKWSHIYIQAPQDEAEIIFYNRFGHNPNRVSCTCCGPDYYIDQGDSLEELSGDHRGCDFDRNTNCYIEQSAGKSYQPYMTVEEYEDKEEVLVIRCKDIKDEEREGDLPEQGYVWVD